ncbi:MAG TPA: hypothetical protein VNN12_04465 [Dehalococcoidia bacterium]|nr:hypothetical protein [Dehalococcoidia bacterium]
MNTQGLRLGFAAVFMVMAGLLFGACGGDGGGEATPTPEASAPTPLPQPTIEGNRYIFPGRGYSATIPEGWTADPNSVASGPMKVDAFFAGEEVEGVQTNITVTCEENPDNVGLSDYLELKLETLRQLDARDLQRLGALQVAGVPAEMVQYSFVREDVTASKVDVMFVGGPCAWTVSLTAAPSAIEAAKTTLNAFLGSFQLLTSEEGSSSAG